MFRNTIWTIWFSFYPKPPCTPGVHTVLQPISKKWSPPMLDFLKANFDGAIIGEVDDAGIGMVICNSLREVMTALSVKIQKPPSMQTLELQAARRTVRFTLKVGFQRSIFEGGYESVNNSLRGPGMLNS
ncbi:hypothetical protein SO802_031632 [Lithocarpus litseifolius]|uniref:RNase H type-1 domain-containing protein n=1 Tax=Lithocarpus litseifolius TaxID=425828 RepID=A0AAW2BMV1_9ROSI